MDGIRLGVRGAASTDTGRQRSNNEDAVLVRGGLLVVADGMGGHEGGEVASAIAIAALEELGDDPAEDAVVAAMIEANARIRAADATSAAPTGMGTTCTAVLVADDGAHVAHIGDSRAYLFRDGILTQLTRDHALLAEMVRTGVLSAEQASHDDRRNVILRALGAAERPDIDVATTPLCAGDRILVCSDGLTAPVADADIAAVLAAALDAAATADRLVRLANEAGGPDNVTVIVADIVHVAHGVVPGGDRGHAGRRRLAVLAGTVAVLALAGVLAVVGIGSLGRGTQTAPSPSHSLPGQTVDETPSPAASSSPGVTASPSVPAGSSGSGPVPSVPSPGGSAAPAG